MTWSWAGSGNHFLRPSPSSKSGFTKEPGIDRQRGDDQAYIAAETAPSRNQARRSSRQVLWQLTAANEPARKPRKWVKGKKKQLQPKAQQQTGSGSAIAGLAAAPRAAWAAKQAKQEAGAGRRAIKETKQGGEVVTQRVSATGGGSMGGRRVERGRGAQKKHRSATEATAVHTSGLERESGRKAQRRQRREFEVTGMQTAGETRSEAGQKEGTEQMGGGVQDDFGSAAWSQKAQSHLGKQEVDSATMVEHHLPRHRVERKGLAHLRGGSSRDGERRQQRRHHDLAE